MAFLVFEGIDGAGKTTLINGLAKALEFDEIPYILTREPGGTKLAEEIRALLLRTDSEVPVPRTELLMYEAARAQHVDTVIRPALEAKKWVICDRFTSSTLAFQSGGRGLAEEPIKWLNEFATDNLKPDLFVLLDLTVEESQNRQQKRFDDHGQTKDRFEQEQQKFHQSVRDHYLKQSKESPNSWLVLDAKTSKEELLGHLIEKLREKQWLEF